MKISSKLIFIIFGLIILLVLIYALFPSSEEIENVSNDNINYEKLNEVVFTVKALPVKKGDLVKHISANGIVKAFNELDIVSNISGYVNKINIYEGMSVSKGNMLLKFDDREYRIAISEAEVNLMNAKIEYGFFTSGFAENISNAAVDSLIKEISELDTVFNEKRINEEEYLNKKEKLDLALLFTGAKRNEVMLNKSGMTNAINAMNRARLNLSYTEITAPFNGVIADFDLVAHQRINTGDKLFKLLDISRLKIEVGVLENEIVRIKKGSKAEVEFSAIPGKSCIGKVLYINPRIDPETKTC